MEQEIDDKKNYQNERFDNWKMKWRKIAKNSKNLMKLNNPAIPQS